MKKEEDRRITPRIETAAQELQSIITRRYPAALFELGPAQDDPEALHLYATVDTDDLHELIDLVLERVLELQLDGLPIHVIPQQTAERIEQTMHARSHKSVLSTKHSEAALGL